jgi:hypothetical protein
MAFAGAAILVSAGIQYYAGEKARAQQKQAMRNQTLASNDAAAAAAANMRKSDLEARRASQRSPDTAGLLQSEQQSALAGPSSTSLTGPNGAMVRPKLGSTSLLG